MFSHVLRIASLSIALLTLGALQHPSPVVGFLMVDAERHYDEERDTYPYAMRVLRPAGYRFGLAEWRVVFGDQADELRTLQALRQFHVLVLDTPFDFSITKIGPAQQRTAAAARAALEQYVREGGGLLVICQAVRYPGDKDQDYANLVLQGFGLEMLHEGVFDRTQAFQAQIASIFAPEGFFRTTNITAEHPVTEGARRLCLPQYHNGNTPGVVALRLSPEWQVLVRGEQTAQSYVVTREHVTDYSQPGTYRAAPPIVAVRGFGKGRVMVYSVPARSVHANYGVPGWNMIVEQAGDVAAGLGSDGARLTKNGIAWLAEPAREIAELGTFKEPPLEPVRFPEQIDLDALSFAPPAQGVRGIIGARTALSDGSGTVADYALAAKASGLAFIVFTESLERMTAERLERLKAECRTVSDSGFYACPGVEFSDEIGNRWAAWSERIEFPQAQFNRAYGSTDSERPALKQWDGKVMHNPGQYWEYCGYPPNMLLTYRNLRDKGAHPTNMWWFFRLPPLVYERGALLENQWAEWLFALRDVRHISPASYTRVFAPSEVAAAAALCSTGGRDLPSLRDWLNTRCGNFVHPAGVYITSGPIVEQWTAINTQHDLPFEVRGKQRARCRFQVSSPEGIREVRVHNADYGIVRRYLARGAKTFAREFEMVHHRDHALTLEVLDMRGRRALSDKVFLFCYKTSLLRCSDNLNFLNGVGLVWHPDRNEMLPLAQDYQGAPLESIRGYDTSSALTRQVAMRCWPIDSIRTKELNDYPVPWIHGPMRKVLDVILPGNDVKIAQMAMGPLVWPYDSPTRDTPARTAVPWVVEENRLFRRAHRSWYLQNRNNMFITWDYRRPREGARDYQGGMVWHEGRIEFKRDATLAGEVPVMLFYLTPSLEEPGTATTVLVSDGSGGTLEHSIPVGRPWQISGRVPPGGFVTAAPCDIGTVFFAGAGTQFRYAAFSNEKTGRVVQLQVGLGEPERRVKAGEVLTYRFAMATLPAKRQSPRDYAARLHDIAQKFGIGGGRTGAKPLMQAGSHLGSELFLHVGAARGEVRLAVPPWPTIVDLPLRMDAVQDNGCVAVWSTARPFFRWVGVADGSAWFQENVDKGSTIWAGNVFLSDQRALKLTLVREGLRPGRAPFLEVHNPTDRTVRAALASPPGTPVYGGTRLTVTVPAGSDVRIPLRPSPPGRATTSRKSK